MHLSSWWSCWWSLSIFYSLLMLSPNMRVGRSMCTNHNYVTYSSYIVEPANSGTDVAIAHGSGNLVPFLEFKMNHAPTGNPTNTPYQKPAYSVCLKCSNATFTAVWSYESYLKSAILLYKPYLLFIKLYIFLHYQIHLF